MSGYNLHLGRCSWVWGGGGGWDAKNKIKISLWHDSQRKPEIIVFFFAALFRSPKRGLWRMRSHPPHTSKACDSSERVLTQMLHFPQSITGLTICELSPRFKSFGWNPKPSSCFHSLRIVCLINVSWLHLIILIISEKKKKIKLEGKRFEWLDGTGFPTFLPGLQCPPLRPFKPPL